MGACGNDSACLAECRGLICAPDEAALMAVLTCVGDHCAAECGDRTSEDCNDCVLAQCGREIDACYREAPGC